MRAVNFGNIVIASALISSVAIAQPPAQVTVEGTRIAMKAVGHEPPGGVKVNDVTLSYGVSYAGLDLASYAGFGELEKRVNDAAQKACKEIGRQYPFATPAAEECAKAAAAKVMVRVRELASAAGEKLANK
jgi:UrcA family protein